MKTLKLLSFILLTCCACSPKATEQKPNKQKIVLAYVTSWSDIIPDPTLVTHINYAFGRVNDTFDGVKISNEERLKMIVGLKQQNPSLKVLLSIGGWESGRFSEMAGNEATRRAFAQDCKRVLTQFGLDGIDMDWEYPTSSEAGISSSPEDTKNYTLLMQNIREAIGKEKLLTLASVCNAKYIDFNDVNPYIDFVNIMTYDIARPPYHHAGLFRSKFTDKISVDESVNAHVEAGMPLNKLVLGIPFYGHGRPPLPDFINYKEIIKLEGYVKQWDDTAKAPYLTNTAGQFVCTYEDPQSINLKCQYLLNKGMLGAMYWEYDGDDSLGTLRKAVYEDVIEK